MPNSIGALSAADLPSIMRLKSAAGWNQTEADWLRLFALSPEGCFGLRVEGELAATTTTVCYGHDLAWIGMVLTLPAFRRRGFARVLMEYAMRYLEQRGVRCVGLDATEMGRPLYESLGFQTDGLIERWVRTGDAAAELAKDLPAGYLPDLDREVIGVDRGSLLRRLEADSAHVPGNGFAMTRGGSEAAYFGPCVANSSEVAERLLKWSLARSEPRMYWDLLPANREAVRIASVYGFERARVLSRMFLGGKGPVSDTSRVFAIAGLEYG